MNFRLFKIRLLLLLFGAFLLAISSFFFVSQKIQLSFFGLTLLLTGIPHGALDFFLDKESNKKNKSSYNAIHFFVKYLLTMLSYAICWWLSPILSLAIFILITAFHFGQIDSYILPNTPFSRGLSFFYGLQIILFLITCHSSETLTIITYIIGDVLQGEDVLKHVNKIFVMCTLSLTITYTLILYKTYKNRFYRLSNLAFAFQTTLLLVLIYFLPFYLGFAFYFGIWHSFLSFEIIMEHLSLRQDNSGWKTLILKALPYCIFAWFGISLIVFVGSTSYQLNELIAGLFIGISILTLPHLNVFSKALKGNKNSKHSLN